jgi:tryptophan-rich sensory protein
MTLPVLRGTATLVAALAAIVVAGVGATVTDLGPWYQNLRQPSWRLPDAAFGPIWTVIFSLAALSASYAWRDTRDPGRRQTLVGLFAFNGFLNVLWSLIFFQLRRPDWALVEVGALWLSVLVLIVATGRTSRTASLLLVPYLVWITTAAALNFEVVRLNGPFP